MPAACNPWAIDQAIERLLATPKTTAFLPCKSADISLLEEMARIPATGVILPSTGANGRFSRRSQRMFSATLSDKASTAEFAKNCRRVRREPTQNNQFSWRSLRMFSASSAVKGFSSPRPKNRRTVRADELALKPEFQSAAISWLTRFATGQLAATKDRPYTQARMAKPTTRLTLCATAPTQIASTTCRKVPLK